MATKDNLVFRIASYLHDNYKPDCGLEISLEKRIPIAAGLGGGSSNAANTIRALNHLLKLDLKLQEMEDIAAIFGSDIVYFLQGGTAFATHRGEVVRPCTDIDIDNILLVNPNIPISSAEAYTLVEVPDTAARRHFDPIHWQDCSYNRLESGVRKRYPEVDDVLLWLIQSGAKPALMSGSGSTCFGVFVDRRGMETCKNYFDSKGYWTKVVRTISKKEYQSVFKA